MGIDPEGFGPLECITVHNRPCCIRGSVGSVCAGGEEGNGYTGKITTSLEVKKLAYPPDHKVCLEEEIDIENYDKAKNFLKLINQKEMATIDKDRLVYKYKNFKVIIDDIKNFKTGVEIERITDKPHVKIITGMKDLAKLLGLDIEKEITDKSVTFLYLKKFARF